MTDATKKKINEAIAECNRFIAIESPRDPSTRPADVAKTLEHAYTHRAKLLAMLQDATR